MDADIDGAEARDGLKVRFDGTGEFGGAGAGDGRARSRGRTFYGRSGDGEKGDQSRFEYPHRIRGLFEKYSVNPDEPDRAPGEKVRSRSPGISPLTPGYPRSVFFFFVTAFFADSFFRTGARFDNTTGFFFAAGRRRAAPAVVALVVLSPPPGVRAATGRTDRVTGGTSVEISFTSGAAGWRSP